MKCSICRGVGSYGEPPKLCEFCRMHKIGQEYASLTSQASAPAPAPAESKWLIRAPDGREWRGDSPLRACAAAQRDTTDPVLAMQRINAMVAEENAIRDAELAEAFERGRQQALADRAKEKP